MVIIGRIADFWLGWYHLILFMINTYQHFPSLSQIPPLWPRVLHPALHAKSPKVQRNPAEETVAKLMAIKEKMVNFNIPQFF